MANLKLRAKVAFPASVLGANGIAISKGSGSYTISLNLGTLGQVSSVGDGAHSLIPFQNTVTGLANSISFSDFVTNVTASFAVSLSSIGTLTPAADKVPYYTGASTAALATFTASARTLTAITVAQGDIVFGSAAGTFSTLAKSASASQFLSNKGTSNAPQWAQPAVTDLAATAAWTLYGNLTAGVASPTAFTIDGLTAKASPAAADEVLLWDVAGSAIKKATVSSIASAGAVGSFNGQTGAVISYFHPQGRLTLTSATPVMTTSVAGATTVYYTPYAGNMVPIYDGTNMVPTACAELSQTTTDTTKSPAACAATSYYDIFVWNDGGTIRATRGPTWTNATTRSLALVLVNGIFLNSGSITNGPATQRGTYVGTIGTNGSSTVDYIFGALAAGGTAGLFNVWNAYNRVDVSTTVRDNTDTWTYAVANTWRAPNGNATMRVSLVRGLDEDAVRATYQAMAVAGATTTAAAAVGLDSTTAFSGTSLPAFVTSAATVASGTYCGTPGIGFHFVSAIELNTTTTASTWLGDFGTTYCQTGLTVNFRA